MGVVVQSSLEMQVLLLSAWLGSALCLPQAAHVSPLAPGLSAHPNPAHTFVAGFQQGAHPNPAHTALRPDCARFQVEKFYFSNQTCGDEDSISLISFHENISCIVFTCTPREPSLAPLAMR